MDALDDLIAVSQSGLSRAFSYDAMKRLVAAYNPENASASSAAHLSCAGASGSQWTTCYSYDNVGNLLTKTDNRGVTIAYGYDPINRPVSKVYSGGNATPNAYFCYDGSYNSFENAVCQSAPAALYGVGRLTEVYNSNSVTQHTAFDALGHVTGHSQITNGGSYSFAYTYNLAGDLTSETYPSGRVVNTGYDAANRVSQVAGSFWSAATTYAGNFAYAPHGGAWNYVMGNGVSHAPVYNGRLQVCGWQDVTAEGGWTAPLAPGAGSGACPNSGVSGGSALLSASLNWGVGTNNGNLVGSTFVHSGGGLSGLVQFSQSYVYDSVNRLTSVTDTGYSRSFGYDPFGNMYIAGATGITPAGNAPQASGLYNGNNQFSSIGNSYDAAGNELLVNGNTLAYDAENRQTSVTYSGSSETYVYDGEGKRVEKIAPGGAAVTVYVYDAAGRLGAEYSNVVEPATCVTCYLSADHLGTARLITDQNGNVVSRHDYLPFGEEIAAGQAGRTGQWGAGNDFVNQKFTGKQRDSESGLDYFGARYYGSGFGRFTSPDRPFADQRSDDPQSWNLYGYVRTNPLRLIDPSGFGAEPAQSWQMRLVLDTVYGSVNRALIASNNSSPRELEKMVDSKSWYPRVYGAVAEATAAALISMAPFAGSLGEMSVQFQPKDLVSQGLHPDLKWQNSNNTVLPDGSVVAAGTNFYGEVKAAGPDNPFAYNQLLSGAASTASTAAALAKSGKGGVAALIVNASTWESLTPDQQKAIRTTAGGGQIFVVAGLTSGTSSVVGDISVRMDG